MNAPEFREALTSGLGRAILYAREQDVEAFRDTILEACLHCWAIDPQSEGTRAGYMLDLVEELPDPQFFTDKVLQSLNGCGDDWDAVQRFVFASYLAMDGNERARAAMYEHYAPGPRLGEEMAVRFVELDGLEGALFAADKLGRMLLDDPEEPDIGGFPSVADEILGPEEFSRALQRAGKENPHIERYRLAVEASKRAIGERLTGRQELERLTYQELRRVFGRRGPVEFRRWGRHASVDELELAARDLRVARSPEEQRQLLSIFAERVYPLAIDDLIALAADDEAAVALAAVAALSNIASPQVRRLAFELVDGNRPGRQRAISLLIKNSRRGDHEVVLSWFQREKERDAIHRMKIDLTRFWECHPDAMTETSMLLWIYERVPCSECRFYTVQRLIELDALPEVIRAECAFDANEDTRRTVSDDPTRHEP